MVKNDVLKKIKYILYILIAPSLLWLSGMFSGINDFISLIKELKKTEIKITSIEEPNYYNIGFSENSLFTVIGHRLKIQNNSNTAIFEDNDFKIDIILTGKNLKGKTELEYDIISSSINPNLNENDSLSICTYFSENSIIFTEKIYNFDCQINKNFNSQGGKAFNSNSYIKSNSSGEFYILFLVKLKQINGNYPRLIDGEIIFNFNGQETNYFVTYAGKSAGGGSNW